MIQSTQGGQQVPPLQLRSAGPYHILAQLGQSAAGPVFLARLAQRDTLYALRLLSPLGPEDVARMRQDASQLARVDHPGVVKPSDMGQEQGRVYVVAEHVPGSSLRELLERKGPMAPRQAALVLAQAAAAMQAAHDAGVVHRHLDASMIVVDGRDGRAKVLGLSVPHDPRRSPPGFLPFAIAPEQARGDKVDARADVYSLGAVLYEVMTGAPPFEGQTLGELSQEVLAGDPEPPSALAAGIPRGVEAACLAALALDPADRPTAGELAQQLERAAEGGGGGGGGKLPLLLVGATLGLLALAAVGWAAAERSSRRATEARLAKRDQEATALGAELEGTKGKAAASEARAEEQQRVREEAERRQQELQSQYAALQGQLAQQRSQAEQAQRAMQVLQQRLQLAAEGGGALTGQVAAVIDGVVTALKAAPGTELLRARLLKNRGQVDEARATLEAGRVRGGARDPALAVLECELTLMTDQPAAMALVERLATEAPGSSPAGAWARLVRVLNGEVDAQQLSALLEAAQAAGPDDPSIRAVAAKVMIAMAQQQPRGQAPNPQVLQDALQAVDAALAVDPTNPELLLERARFLSFCFMASGGRQRELVHRALGDLRVGRDIHPLPAFWCDVGHALALLGQLDQASAELIEARRRADQGGLPADRARARSLLGQVRLQGGDESGAVQSWLEALQAAPNESASYEWTNFLNRGLSPAAGQRLMSACPPQVRAELEQLLRQNNGGGRR